MPDKNHLQKNVVIVAGGSGNRMNSELPKQFLLLDNLPVLMHSINAFYQYNKSIFIVVVLPENYIKTWEKLKEKFSFAVPHIIAKGGKTRFHSVKNGLELISGTGITGIHDAARPLVSIKTIENCYESALKSGSGVPFILPIDSVRVAGKRNSKPIDRNGLRLIQTPQCFGTIAIQNAYKIRYSKKFTDDASVYEKAGGTVILVEGNAENIKITSPSDLIIAEALLKK